MYYRNYFKNVMTLRSPHGISSPVTKLREPNMVNQQLLMRMIKSAAEVHEMTELAHTRDTARRLAVAVDILKTRVTAVLASIEREASAAT